MSRLAIIDYNKCQPKKCNFECGIYCPVNMQDKECVSIKFWVKKKSCVLCINFMYIKKCPFNATININKQLKNDFLLQFW